MFGLNTLSSIEIDEPQYNLSDYQSAVPRWCPGCGDNAILTAVQRLCRDEQLPPEKTVFVSGIGCSSRFPHHMGTYGFHGLHGRALPIAEGVKIRRPDLNVFVNMGDGDCCSIGTAHWIHAIRYNMNLVVLVHDNQIYGMTKKQASPTSPKGLKTNTTPHGSYTEPLNILSTTLGVGNVSFVANAVEWIPDLLYQIIQQAFHHRGLSFVRIAQRCPHFMPGFFDGFMTDPNRCLLLEHENGLQVPENLTKVYQKRVDHDPSDINRAREVAAMSEAEPIGILYRNDRVECYEDSRRPRKAFSVEARREAINLELDKFAVHVGSRNGQNLEQDASHSANGESGS
ncbi:MAG: 2-oxoglutarate oxidoreductase [Rhodothermales bacterium]|nr:2-oxoglutarate oxidoreductase [Rhodothermales bacterium]